MAPCRSSGKVQHWFKFHGDDKLCEDNKGVAMGNGCFRINHDLLGHSSHVNKSAMNFTFISSERKAESSMHWLIDNHKSHVWYFVTDAPGLTCNSQTCYCYLHLYNQTKIVGYKWLEVNKLTILWNVMISNFATFINALEHHMHCIQVQGKKQVGHHYTHKRVPEMPWK